MRKLLLLGSACLVFTSAQAQYECATALPVIPEALTWVNGIEGTEVPLPNCAPTSGNGEGGMWYTYTPVVDHLVRVTTDLTINVGRDTRLHVYTGECGALTCVAGDDDSGAGALAVVTFEAVQGTTYIIAFDDRWDSAGFTFLLEELEPMTSGVSFTPVYYGPNYAWCVVDMNADGLDDIVSAGSSSVVIYHQQFDGGFEVQNSNITFPATHSPSWSVAAGDVDANGFMDLVYGGGSGVSFMMASDDGLSFGAVNFEQYVFSQRSNFVDINNDGNLDAFMCHDVDANVYFFNDGAGNLTFNQGMLGPNGGNYGSIWTDYDDDGDIDMFIAKCGSSPPDVFMRNNGDGTFTDVAGPLGFADGHQSWSSAWGDYDNDGDLDVLVGSSSSNYHKLMSNNGDGTFTNVTAGSGFDTFGGLGIDWVTHDFNNDGFLDILGGQALMLSNGDFTFTKQEVMSAPTEGPIGDLNNDGFLDIVGGNSVYFNNPNGNNWIKVLPEGVQSNLNAIGAKVEVTTPQGTQMREIRSGDGFHFMSTLGAYFGLGTADSVISVVVRWPSGEVDAISDPEINGTVQIMEGMHPMGVSELKPVDITLYPVPATDRLMVRSERPLGNVPAVVLDATGRRVLQITLGNEGVDISSLRHGAYVLRFMFDGRPVERTFVKL